MKRKDFKALYSIVILALYLVFGTLLVIKYLIRQEEPNLSFGLFGFVVAAYGIFRAYRAYKEYKSLEENEINENE